MLTAGNGAGGSYSSRCVLTLRGRRQPCMLDIEEASNKQNCIICVCVGGGGGGAYTSGTCRDHQSPVGLFQFGIVKRVLVALQ